MWQHWVEDVSERVKNLWQKQDIVIKLFKEQHCKVIVIIIKLFYDTDRLTCSIEYRNTIMKYLRKN